MESLNHVTLSTELIDFIKRSPSCFHAVENIAAMLREAGAVELYENRDWPLEAGKSYFVRRNFSSIVAFTLPETRVGGLMIAAAHSDSPTFRIKDKPELEGTYIRLSTERYGGMILDSWFDRPLSAAGRVVVRVPEGVRVKLVSLNRDVMLIPHVAIHMQNPNEGIKYNPAVDLMPLYGTDTAKGSFMRQIADAAGVSESDILAHDLFLVNRQPATIWGEDSEFVSSPKLDDLQCAYLAARAYLDAERRGTIPVLFVADNEEVGSATKQGAGSDFLVTTLSRVAEALEIPLSKLAADSMLLSADNAHALHPNRPELADATHRPLPNKGIVVKYSASQTYTTDAVSSAIFREICREADVPVQVFHNRSDMRGGSTLGNISNSQLSLNAVDIGIAQLAMHSSYETSGTRDCEYMYRAMKQFYRTVLRAGIDSYAVL